ncbi:disintegrin and metalloproteinase domain-containing protein 5 isoform X1 [Ictidomys tridecemlineatus]
MLLLVVLLTGLGGLHAGRKSHKSFLHTTVPERISSTDAKHDRENRIAYIITIEGKPYFVHLKKQSFLSPSSLIYSYDKNGTEHSEPLLAQMNCNYNGYVAGFINSLVTLNICSGLRGIMQFKDVSYGIEPIDALSGFIHMIYEEKSNQINIPHSGKRVIYAESDESPHEGKKAIPKDEYASSLFPRYLELHIVVDKNLFDYMGSDVKTVTQKVIHVIGLVNTMLAQLKLTVILSSIEIWSYKNKISTVGAPENVLFRFLNWKHDNFKFHNNISYLFAFVKHSASVGITFPGKVCENNFDAGIALYSEGLSWESFAVTIVQLLGVTIGLDYDNSAHCYCSGETCTMTPKAVYAAGIKDFSTCSVDNFKYLTSKHGLSCLEKNPFDMPVRVEAQRKICGNGIIEGTEECDCGTSKNCTHKDCCDPSSCKLKPSAVCGSGECCTVQCKIKPANILCRKSFDSFCDFKEFCDGKNAYCVEDTFSRNGQECDSGRGYCFDGICRSFDKQCQNLIGSDSRGGSFACYEEINSRIDRFGNCGPDVCRFPNTLCGKLVCTWPHKELISRANFSVIYSHVRDQICVSTYPAGRKPAHDTLTTYKTPEDRDETFVEDGTMCGPDMYCERMQCKEVRFIIDESVCNATRNCDNHGVCNNFNHCHCEEGYTPPDCAKKAGGFGSVDDGHEIKMAGKSADRGPGSSQKQYFQVSMYVSIPLLIITIALLINQDKIRKQCFREESEADRSMAEENTTTSSIKSSPTENNSS